jgi:hypothetical protein
VVLNVCRESVIVCAGSVVGDAIDTMHRTDGSSAFGRRDVSTRFTS